MREAIPYKINDFEMDLKKVVNISSVQRIKKTNIYQITFTDSNPVLINETTLKRSEFIRVMEDNNLMYKPR